MIKTSYIIQSKKNSWILPFAKVFSRENVPFRESFFREICPKHRHSRKFLSNSSRFFRHAKVSALKVVKKLFLKDQENVALISWVISYYLIVLNFRGN